MILITGATGLVGQQLIARLAPSEDIVCLVRPARRVRRFAPGVSVRIVSGDIDDAPTLRLAMHGVDSVVHLAAISQSQPNGRTMERVNVDGTRHVLEASQEVGVRRLIFMSPIGADPHSAFPFLRSKGQAEELVRASGLDYTIVRLSAVYGDGDNWTLTMAMGLHAVPFVFPIPGDGRSRLQPMHVEDVVECLVRCLADPLKVGQTAAIGGPQILSFNEVVDEIMKATGVRRRKTFLNVATARSLANLCGRLFGRPPFTEAMIDILQTNWTTTLDSVPYQFGFQPMRMSDSLGYLAAPRPWRRMFARHLLARD